MIWNPWWQNRLLRERMTLAEDRVRDMQLVRQIHYTDRVVMQRELSLAHAALRRKNIALKLLRTRVAKKEQQL